MIRMTLALSLAIYGGLVIWGDPVSQAEAGVPSIDADDAVAAAIAPAADTARPVILPDAASSGPDVTRAAVSPLIAPAAASAPDARPARIGTPSLVSLVAYADPAPFEADAPAGASGPVLRVTGDRVNMRSGPSTANGVLASLPAGTLAEPLGEPSGGWQEIRVIETGTTGFMAARFLDPA